MVLQARDVSWGGARHLVENFCKPVPKQLTFRCPEAYCPHLLNHLLPFSLNNPVPVFHHIRLCERISPPCVEEGERVVMLE